MTLGLTSSGAIKIKTDGGLRAVNCACCGGCQPVTFEQYSAVVNGGTANLANVAGAPGSLNPQVANFQFFQNYSYTVREGSKQITYSEVEGYGFHQETLREIVCEQRPSYYPPGVPSEFYTWNDRRIELGDVIINLSATIDDNPQIPPIYTMTAYTGASLYIEEDAWECDPTLETPGTNNAVNFSSVAFCGPPLYKWLMKEGPAQTGDFSLPPSPPENP